MKRCLGLILIGYLLLVSGMPLPYINSTEDEVYIVDTKFLVLDSGEVYVPGETVGNFFEKIEEKSVVFSSPIKGSAVVMLHFDTTRLVLGKEVARTYDEVVKLYGLSRKCSAEEEAEIKRLAIYHMQKKKIIVSYLSPYSATYVTTVVQFTISGF